VLGGTAFADTSPSVPRIGRTVTAASTERGPRPDILAYTFVGTVAVQTNRTNQKTHRQPGSAARIGDSFGHAA
jgi:hypothetical protein